MGLMIYIIIGVLLGFALRIEDDKFAITHPGLAFIIIVAWPILLFYLAGRVKNLKYKGKTIWTRK